MAQKTENLNMYTSLFMNRFRALLTIGDINDWQECVIETMCCTI